MSETMVRVQTLEERVTSRIRESIGELMTDDDLRGIVQRGVEKALFEGREIQDGYHRKLQPSLVDQLVDRHLATQMREAVEQWLKANPEKLQAAVEAAIKAGVADALIRTLDLRFASIFDAGIQTMRYQGLLPPMNP